MLGGEEIQNGADVGRGARVIALFNLFPYQLVNRINVKSRHGIDQLAKFDVASLIFQGKLQTRDELLEPILSLIEWHY